MQYEREGHRHGAWVIRLGARSVTVQAIGDHSFPELDSLHVPRVSQPNTWDDYSNELAPDAQRRLLEMLDSTGTGNAEPPNPERLAALIDHAKWKFAWTYARTYPHEYTTKKLCDPDDHAALIDQIEHFGVVERFGDQHRKYWHFRDRKYWHMGEPSSKDPEEWPNVINRTWVDVRRHAENVKHRWTPEEVELQMRIWEIQLEKSTDKRKNTA
jgi:hypothetical protein